MNEGEREKKKMSKVEKCPSQVIVCYVQRTRVNNRWKEKSLEEKYVSRKSAEQEINNKKIRRKKKCKSFVFCLSFL